MAGNGEASLASVGGGVAVGADGSPSGVAGGSEGGSFGGVVGESRGGGSVNPD